MIYGNAQSIKPTVYIPVKLQKQLEIIHNYPLIVLQAPSGFGKTTVISEYLSQLNTQQVYWYTCMGEPLRKAWNGICKAFSNVDISVAKQLETLEYPTKENLVDIVDILNSCNIVGDAWLIIDNFQYIQNELPERILYALSSHRQSGLHIVVVTQSISMIDISGIPAHHAIFIRNDAFFFQKIDTDAYFRTNGIALSNDELSRLQMLSEGWIAVLNLQLIRYYQEGDFEVTDSMDSLIRAVIWNRMENAEQKFLITVSLLKRFTLEQAYILMENDTLLPGIAQLLRGGSFIRYEGDRGTYTLHSLLQNFLRQEFKRLPSYEIRRMQNLCADAYVVEGEQYYALCAYLEAGEMEKLLSLQFKASDFSLYLKDGSAEILERVLRECDEEMLESYPHTLSMITFELFRAGSYVTFLKGCLMMEKIISQREQKGINKEDTQILTGQLALLQSFAVFNDIEKMSVLHRKAWEALGGPFSNRADWNDSWTFGQPSVLYLFWSESGALDRELKCMDECLPYYINLTEGHGTGASCAMRAEALLMRGDDNAAETMCHKAIYLASAQAQDSICICAEMTLLRIALLRGDIEGYENGKKRILKRAKTGSEPAVKTMADLALALVCILTGEDIAKWLTDLERITVILYSAAVSFGVLTYLSWLLSQGQDAKMIGIAQGALVSAQQQHFVLPQVYFYIFMAVAYHRLGQDEVAEVEFDHAISLALPDGIFLPFAEYSDELSPLIKERENLPGMTEMMKLCQRQNIGVEKIRKSIYLNQLTPREREIAYLAAGGLTNRDIASRLFISQETVKTTMKSIFQKLCTRSRVQLKDMKDAGKI